MQRPKKILPKIYLSASKESATISSYGQIHVLPCVFPAERPHPAASSSASSANGDDFHPVTVTGGGGGGAGVHFEGGKVKADLEELGVWN